MDTVLRVVAVYVVVLLGLRVLGKREFGELSPFELVTLLVIPEILQNALVRDDYSLTNAVVGVCTLLGLVWATSVLSHLSPRFEQVVASRPAVLVRHGYLVPGEMNRERVPPQEIVAEMHKVGLERLDQVKWGILESDGKIAFVPWMPPPSSPRPGQTPPAS